MTAPQKPLLNIENLNISYKVGKEFIPAVRDFELQLKRGEIYGIVGESGSGKSTIAKALLQFLDKGGRIEKKSRIDLLGDDLTKKSRREMQHLWGQQLKLVPQNAAAALNPSVKVGQQVAEVLQAATGTDEKTALQAAIDVFHQVKLVDPEKVADRYPHELSGGMQQRITIAMALISDPDLLVMDEPTTGLDVTTEAVILDLIRDLITENDAGVIYITHNLGVVAQLCERISVLYAGEIMEDADTDDLFAQPYHPYTIGLLSSIPRVGQTREQSILQSIPGNPPSLQDLPSGCVFADRCPVAIDKCVDEKPPLEKPAAGRMVRCHRWQEIASGELNVVRGIDTGATYTDRADGRQLMKIENLSKHFPVAPTFTESIQRKTPSPIRAVDGVNLTIREGQTLGLVGESGSGKTTLSQVIIGLQERTDGNIELLGMDIRNQVRDRSPDVLAKIQMVFQNPQNSLNPYHTVAQTLRRPLMKLRGVSRADADAEVAELLKAVNLRPEYARRYPGELSGGEKQRVAIARAFASDPDLVICDEPVSALDVSVQSAVLNLLARLQSENGVSYLFISHDLAVVGYLADYVAVMYLGQLFEVGTARDLFQPPYHPYTEALVSAIPVADPTHDEKRILLEGSVPSARKPPTGCRFHTRCPHKIGAICEEDVPSWRDSREGHHIKCHIPLDELREIQSSIVQVES